MLQMSTMIALAVALTLGGDKLFNNTDGAPRPAAGQTDYNNNDGTGGKPATAKGINPVQHSE